MEDNIDYDHEPLDYTRYRFLQDDNCHWFLIPVGEEKEFHTWLAACCEYGFDNYKGKDFYSYAIDGYPGFYTFMAPRREK